MFVDHTADLREIVDRINALPHPVPNDATQAARNGDYAGLAYIINLAHGYPGNFKVRLGTVLDVADLIQGITPKMVNGRGSDRSMITKFLFDEPSVLYEHPEGRTFRQYINDPVPAWAVNVRPGPTDREFYARPSQAEMDHAEHVQRGGDPDEIFDEVELE